jgi:hypothetical protein
MFTQKQKSTNNVAKTDYGLGKKKFSQQVEIESGNKDVY